MSIRAYLDSVRAQHSAYRTAKSALDLNSEVERLEGVDSETVEFLRLNYEVVLAERALPWWARW